MPVKPKGELERKTEMEEKKETTTLREEIISLAVELLDEHIEAFLELAK